jgi:hypothetical protein
MAKSKVSILSKVRLRDFTKECFCPFLVPTTTYVMGGEHKIPVKVQEKAASTGGELVPNLLLLGS